MMAFEPEGKVTVKDVKVSTPVMGDLTIALVDTDENELPLLEGCSKREMIACGSRKIGDWQKLGREKVGGKGNNKPRREGMGHCEGLCLVIMFSRKVIQRR